MYWQKQNIIFVFSYYLVGIFGRSLLVSIHNPDQRLRLLLRTYISHHQTSKQEGRWSCWSYSRRSYGDHVTWSKRWTGSAAGDWSYNWPQVVSHRDECHKDDDQHHRFLYDILEFPCYYKFTSATWGQYVHQCNLITLLLPVLYDYQSINQLINQNLFYSAILRERIRGA